MQQSFLQKSKAVQAQFALVFILAVGYILIITDTDITFFDSYVLRIISECYPSNQSNFCIKARQELGCNMTDQQCIGNVYWRQLEKQAIALAGVLFFARLIPSLINHFTGRKKFRILSIFESFLWSVTSYGLMLSGFVDYLYYKVRGIPVPNELPWLNDTGLFKYTKELTGNITNVDIADLYITVFLGIGMIVIIWLLAMYLYSKQGIKSLT